MDFSTLGENSIIHIIRKKPFEYLTGKLKSKGIQQQQFPIFQQTVSQPFDLVVTVNGNDEVLPGVQPGMEIVEYNNSYYSTTTEGIQQALANMMQMATNGKAEQAYYDSVLEKGEKYMEHLNPQYAEGKRQARTIKDMQDRIDAQDKRMSKMEEQNGEMLRILRQFDNNGSQKK